MPSLDRLTAALTTVFRADGPGGRVTVLGREMNPQESSFPTEVVTCQVGDPGRRLRLFVKYGTGRFNRAYGHRGNVGYEARVYRDVLRPLGTSTPTFYGVYRARPSADPWLIIEYLEEGLRTTYFKDPGAMTQAAGWIGKFHAANERRVRGRDRSFLRRYEDAYYRGWSRRTGRLYAPWRTQFPWLTPLRREFEERIPTLLAAPQTVIHGEYFSNNILYRNGTSWPLDWQSTAVAPGEIDLVSLTHSWPTEFVQRCERAYRNARWPDGAPPGFEDRVVAARLYVDFRWLGDPLEMAPPIGWRGNRRARRKAKRFLDDLHDVAETLSLGP